MGAWGTGIFENDEAADFGQEVATEEGVTRLKDALERALSLPFVDNDVGSRAAAAAATVLALGGRAPADLPPELAKWTDDHGVEFGLPLCSLAIAAVERVLGSSETAELWEESDDGQLWRRNMLNIETGLQDLAKNLP